MPRRYVPERGDIVWLQFSPQAGSEQAGYRPAIVVSPRVYNQKAGLALFCPITSQVKGYPFEVLLPKEGKATGVILVDQIRSLDWRARNVKRMSNASRDVIEEVLAKIHTLLGVENLG